MIQFNSLIKTCSYLLHSSPQAEECRSYLNDRLSSEMQQEFGFGFFQLNLLKNFINEAELKTMGLLYSKEIADANYAQSVSFSYFDQHPLILPYRNVYGEVAAIVGRSLLSDTERTEQRVPKYKNTKFVKGNHLFGLFENKNAIRQANFVYVVEGQFDMIKAREKGLNNVIALGSADMTAWQLSLICRFTNNLLLLLDNDEAGMKGRKRIKEKYGKLANISNVFLPAGYKDLDSYLLENDAETMSLISKDVQ